MAETLETVAEKIDALGRSIDERFAKVDGQFAKVDGQFAKVDGQFAKVDEQFAKVDTTIAETKSQLGVKIEAVAENVLRVYDAVINLTKRDVRNSVAHARIEARLDSHDLRLLALEPPKTPDR